jgi:hypothetical protein
MRGANARRSQMLLQDEVDIAETRMEVEVGIEVPGVVIATQLEVPQAGLARQQPRYERVVISYLLIEYRTLCMYAPNFMPHQRFQR